VSPTRLESAPPRRRHVPGAAALVLALAAVAAAPARAEAPAAPPATAASRPAAAPPRRLVVGTKPTPPFVIKERDGSWSGASMELWRDVSNDLGLTYEVQERDLEGLLRGATDGSLDVVVAALTVTAKREQAFDFCHPYYSTGLGIAVRPTGGGWTQTLRNLVSPAFLKVIGGLALLLFLAGLLVWLFERRRNPEQFGGVRGLGAGFWWSAVTMTTVGYGDKAPRTLLGRLIGIVWMFAAIIIISSFTAALSSSLTVSRLESSIRGPEDLPRARVGSVGAATSGAYLRQASIKFTDYDSPAAGLAALAAGKIDAFVYDQPILRYLAHQQKLPVMVLPETFDRQDYAFAVGPRSPLRERINGALIPHLRGRAWQETLDRYLGK
jgi:polar amino acid transport system substrate-binding protein